MDAYIHNRVDRVQTRKEYLAWLVDMNNKFSQFTNFYADEYNRLTKGDTNG